MRRKRVKKVKSHEVQAISLTSRKSQALKKVSPRKINPHLQTQRSCPATNLLIPFRSQSLKSIVLIHHLKIPWLMHQIQKAQRTNQLSLSPKTNKNNRNQMILNGEIGLWTQNHKFSPSYCRGTNLSTLSTWRGDNRNNLRFLKSIWGLKVTGELAASKLKKFKVPPELRALKKIQITQTRFTKTGLWSVVTIQTQVNHFLRSRWSFSIERK